MEEYIKELLNRASELSPLFLWFFIFFSNILENVFPPWPGDTVNVFGGFLVANNSGLTWFSLITSTYLGNIFGGLVMYKFGERFLNFLRQKKLPFTKELLEEESFNKTLSWFQRNSNVVILLSRFSAGIRFFVSIVAGITRVPVYRFIVLFSIAVFLWCSLLIGGGYITGKNWESILQILSVYNKVIMGLLVVVLLLIFRNYLLKKQIKN